MLTLSQYGKKIAEAHRKQDHFLIRTQVLCWTLLIFCMHIILHPYFMHGTFVDETMFAKLSIYAIVLVCILFLSVMIYYVNEILIKQSRRALGVMCINGMSMKQLRRYLVEQGLRIQKRSIPISLMLSVVLLPICNVCANFWLQENANIFQYNLHAYLIMILIFLLIWCFLLLGDMGYVYRTEIQDLLSGEYRQNITSMVEMPAKMAGMISFALVYVVVMLGFPPESLYNIIKFAILAMIAAAIACIDCISILLKKLQGKHHLHAQRSIVYGEVPILFKSGALLVNLLCMACGCVSIMLCFYTKEADKVMVVLLCLMMMLVLLDICFVQHLKLYMKQNQRQYASLLSLGYRIQDIKSIVLKEAQMFFAILYGFAYLVTGVACIQLMRYHITTLPMVLLVILIHIGGALGGYGTIRRIVQTHQEV